MTILKQHKSFLKRLSDEIVSVYDNSSKKGVLVVPYNPDTHVNIETKVSPIVDKYGAEFVICSCNPLQIHRNLFYSVAPEPNLCALYDHTTGKVDWFQENNIENIMKERYGIGH
ncbi:hypothetical protein CAEBREN_02055 [Caenorhabditis brenneri]|uniref:Uncharacterized protein n=1 Tax=Caenorhabditis brenneri TaxID=135651 RepID=G0MUZ2_CAEBE|nr:hypothetical protein CAEBREN_02055 [Caenorhabditis brenneri]